jgi:hypothetical protein
MELSPAQLGWRPKPGAWSVVECLDHLLTTHRLYLGSIERIGSIERTLVKSGAPSSGNAAFEGGRLAGWFIGLLGPDSRRRLKSPSIFQPPPVGVEGDSDPRVVRRFAAQQRQIMSVIEKSRDVDLQQVKVASPASVLLRFRLGDALRMMVEHNKRHLKQADAVMASSGFPPD